MISEQLPQTFYDAKAKNRWRTAMLMLLFPAMILTITYLGIVIMQAYGGSGPDPLGSSVDAFFAVSPFVIVGTALWTILMLFRGKNMVLRMAGARPIAKADAPEVYRIVENLAIRTGIKTPAVYIIEDESLNAFATGYSPDKAVVAVTRGIMGKLTKEELEAVLAHEFGHILNRDIRVMLIAVTLVGILQLMSDMILRGVWYGGRSRRSNSDGKNNGGGGIIILAIIAVWLIGFIGSVLVQLGISRKREFLADAESAYLTRNPEALMTALQKISSDARVEVLDGKRSIAALCIEDPLENKASRSSLLDSLQGLFSTHPSTKHRIEELRRMMA